MDGHERHDVVEYRNKEFLPKMEKFEERMAKLDKEGRRSMPTLKEGEKRIITLFYDECCFHAWDESNSAWLQKGEQPLRKKGRGCLIHVSDFILEDTGRLVLRKEDGTIVDDARKNNLSGC